MSILTELTAPPKPPRGAQKGLAAQPDEPFRFADVVRAAYPDFVATEISERRAVASGIVPLRALVIRATFSIDREKATARLEVRFKVSKLRISDFERVERTINGQPQLVKARFDAHHRLGFLGAFSAYGIDPKGVVRTVASQLRMALQTDEVLSFLTAEADSEDTGCSVEGGYA